MALPVERLRGSMTALITPFRDERVDAAAFQKLCDWQIHQGTDALVPVGTTGESPTVSPAEHAQVVELAIEAAGGRVPVIAGAGSNATSEAIAYTQHAQKAGADAALLVAPYYNKPTQEGLYLHYKAIHDASDLPLIVYNIPGRSIVDISVETMKRLADLPRIVGVKDATNDLARPIRETNAIGPDWVLLSGEDGTALSYLAQGGRGCISVTANVAPALCAALHDAWAAGHADEALAIQRRLMPLHEALFCESSPGPVKYAASLLGLSTPDVRLPLAPIAAASRARVEAALRGLGLIG